MTNLLEDVATAIELCDKPYSSEHLARAVLEVVQAHLSVHSSLPPVLDKIDEALKQK